MTEYSVPLFSPNMEDSDWDGTQVPLQRPECSRKRPLDLVADTTSSEHDDKRLFLNCDVPYRCSQSPTIPNWATSSIYGLDPAAPYATSTLEIDARDFPPLLTDITHMPQPSAGPWFEYTETFDIASTLPTNSYFSQLTDTEAKTFQARYWSPEFGLNSPAIATTDTHLHDVPTVPHGLPQIDSILNSGLESKAILDNPGEPSITQGPEHPATQEFITAASAACTQGFTQTILLSDAINPYSPTSSFQNQPSPPSSVSAVAPSGRCGTESEAQTESKLTVNSSTINELVDFECDACFGVINATAISAFSGSQITPVNVSVCGGLERLKLAYQDSSQYAGILDLPVLHRLMNGYKVRLKAQLMPSKSQPEQAPGLKPKKCEGTPASKRYPVRVVLYGMRDDSLAIGKELSKAAVYLQHPLVHECNNNMKYCNPHYLLRPGSEMPRLEQMSLTDKLQTPSQPDHLDEARMSRLLQIFDSADTESGRVSITVHPSPRISSTLMEHQLTALTMMVERECGVAGQTHFPTMWVPGPDNQYHRHIITGEHQRRPSPIRGGILADEMGLGKSLSTLALICSSLDEPHIYNTTCDSGGAGLKATLLVSPKSTVHAWQTQISKHILPGQLKSALYHGPKRQLLTSDFEHLDVILTTYETLRSDWEASGPLFAGKWLRVVLDEAHRIRNRSSRVFNAAVGLRARYRWCLSGTPIHNSLDDYGALLTFIQVEPFNDKSLFDYWIAGPIKTDQPRSLQRLKDLVRATCLRRTKRSPAVRLDLEKPTEKTERVTLSSEDQELYEFFRKKTANLAMAVHHNKKAAGKGRKDAAATEDNILSLMNILKLICNHGKALLPANASTAWLQRDSSSFNWKTLAAFRRTCVTCGAELQDLSPVSSKAPTSPVTGYQDSFCDSCEALGDADTISQPHCDREKKKSKSAGRLPHCQSYKLPEHETTRPSAKVEALLRNLHNEQNRETLGGTITKSVIFSYWTKMLDLIELATRRSELCKFQTIQRIDGKTSLEARGEALRQFNENDECTIMLASIGSCGEGVDFTAANHVHIMEPHWSPMAEAQAIDRVHRKGQTKPVTVTRYIVPQSIETYIQWVQQDKLSLINKSMSAVDEETGSTREIEGERWKVLRAYLEKQDSSG